MNAGLDIAELVRVLKRWRWIITLVPACCLLVAAILVFFIIPPTYEAYTTLLVGRNIAREPQAAISYEDLVLSRQLVKTYSEIVKSWTVSEEVIRQLRLAMTVEQFAQKVSVTLVEETQVIRLGFFDGDPSLAQRVANSTASVFAQRVPELMKLNNVAVLDPARLPVVAAKPRKALAIALAGTAGLMATLLFILAVEYLDTRIQSRNEAEKILGVPVLGTIPKRALSPEGDATSPFLPLLDDPKSPVAEAYRSLRTNVQFLCNTKGAHIIAITSAQPMEGKTTVAANLAIGMAQTGKRVTLVDADLRRPTMHRVMGTPNESGLADLLVGGSDAPEQLLTTTMIAGLRILPSGPVPANPAELLESQRFADVLAYLRSISDLIIIDTPPITAVTDAAIISSLSSGVLLVTNGTTHRTAAVAQSALRQVSADILGVILNQVTLEADRYYDYYTSR